VNPRTVSKSLYISLLGIAKAISLPKSHFLFRVEVHAEPPGGGKEDGATLERAEDVVSVTANIRVLEWS
jgi:hypothetical protein